MEEGTIKASGSGHIRRLTLLLCFEDLKEQFLFGVPCRSQEDVAIVMLARAATKDLGAEWRYSSAELPRADRRCPGTFAAKPVKTSVAIEAPCLTRASVHLGHHV
jgi:hypothetical protein